MAVFEYDLLRPLAHQPDEMDIIRLLEIHTSDMCSPMIKFSLRKFALEAAPSYMALSYCWGDPNIKQPIWAGDAVLDVTTNLHAALTHIRAQFKTCLTDHGDENEELRSCTCLQDDHRPRWLWVDAICINQESNEEKAQQVPLMRQIYSKATKTLIWLGPDIRFYGILLISRLALASRKYHERGDTRVIFQMDLSAQEFYNIPHGFSRQYKELRSLLESPWFQRVWIIQEVAVSKKVLIRSHSLTVEWEDLESAVNFAAHIGALPLWNNTEIAQQVINIGFARKLTLKDNQQPLLALLLLYRKYKASKDHDKIYALYNLAADGGPSRLNIIPNYDIDCAEVYKDLAVSMIRMTQNLDILSAPHPSTNIGVRNLPSWVPDWSISDDTVALRGGPVWFDFAAAPPDGLDSAIFSENDNILGLLGHTIDIIQVTGKLRQEYTEKKLSRLQRMQRAPSDQLVFNDWENVSGCRSGREYLNGESIMDAY
jgi:hypothetical protein